MSKRKIITVILSTVILVFFSPIIFAVKAESEEENILENRIDEKIDYSELESYWNQLVNDYGSYLPEIEKMNFHDLLKNEGKISLKHVFSNILKYFFHEIILNGKLLSTLLLLAIFSAILQSVHSAFDNSTISKITYFMIYLVLFYLALNSFMVTFSYATSAVYRMSDFMIALIPLLLGLLATIGNFLTVSFFHPIIIFIINLTNIIVSKFLLSLLLTSFLLMMVSYINTQYQVTYLATFLKNISLGTLGVFSTLFISIMTLQGTASAVQDGLALKTAKFVTGNFIPVIGQTFTDAVDIVLNISMTLKNAIGIVGVLIIALYTLFPAIKIFVVAILYRLAAAIIQPIGDESIVKTLHEVSNYTFYILAILLLITFIFFITIVIIILSSNITMFIK